MKEERNFLDILSRDILRGFPYSWAPHPSAMSSFGTRIITINLLRTKYLGSQVNL